MKNPTIVAALISAVIAAIVSAGMAFWTSRSTVKLEMDKVIVAAQQNALQQIIQARLKAYPAGYCLTSQMVKDAHEKRIDHEYLEGLRSAFDGWDSKNGYLLGPESSNTAFAFRHQLLSVIKESKQGDFSLKELLVHAERLELALRSDLGIYGFQLQGPTPELQTPRVDRY